MTDKKEARKQISASELLKVLEAVFAKHNPELMGILLMGLLHQSLVQLRHHIEEGDPEITWEKPFAQLDYPIAYEQLAALMQNEEHPLTEEAKKLLDEHLFSKKEALTTAWTLAEDRMGAQLLLLLQHLTQNAFAVKKGGKATLYASQVTQAEYEHLPRKKREEYKRKVAAGWLFAPDDEGEAPFGFHGKSDAGEEWEVDLIFQVPPLVIDADENRAFFPLLVGLNFKKGDRARWTEKDKAEFWDGVLNAVEGFARTLEKDGERLLEAEVQPPARVRPPVPMHISRGTWRPDLIPREVQQIQQLIGQVRGLFSNYESIPDLDPRGAVAKAEAERLFAEGKKTGLVFGLDNKPAGFQSENVKSYKDLLLRTEEYRLRKDGKDCIWRVFEKSPGKRIRIGLSASELQGDIELGGRGHDLMGLILHQVFAASPATTYNVFLDEDFVSDVIWPLWQERGRPHNWRQMITRVLKSLSPLLYMAEYESMAGWGNFLSNVAYDQERGGWLVDVNKEWIRALSVYAVGPDPRDKSRQSLLFDWKKKLDRDEKRRLKEAPTAPQSMRLLILGKLRDWSKTQRTLSETILKEITPHYEIKQTKKGQKYRYRVSNELGGREELYIIEGQTYHGANGNRGNGYRVREWLSKVDGYPRRRGYHGLWEAYRNIISDFRGILGVKAIKGRTEPALDVLESMSPTDGLETILKVYIPANREARLHDELQKEGLYTADTEQERLAAERTRLEERHQRGEYTGKELQLARRMKKLTQERLAEAWGIPRSYLAQIETGRRPIPAKLTAKVMELIKTSVSKNSL